MCHVLDPLTHLHCLRADGHGGEHVAMGYDSGAHWTVSWADPAEFRKQIRLHLESDPKRLPRAD